MATEYNMSESNMGRRKFLKGMAALAGAGAAAGILVACGDPTATIAPAATTAPVVPNTTAPAASTTAPAANTTAPAANTTAPAASTTAPAANTTAPAASGGSAPAGYTEIGAVSSFKADADPAAFEKSGTKGYVYNQGGTYLAFSDKCTHKGCDVPFKADQAKFVCPCHGSQYDKTGTVLKGPAAARLPLFEVSVVNGTLYAKLT